MQININPLTGWRLMEEREMLWLNEEIEVAGSGVYRFGGGERDWGWGGGMVRDWVMKVVVSGFYFFVSSFFQMQMQGIGDYTIQWRRWKWSWWFNAWMVLSGKKNGEWVFGWVEIMIWDSWRVDEEDYDGHDDGTRAWEHECTVMLGFGVAYSIFRLKQQQYLTIIQR